MTEECRIYRYGMYDVQPSAITCMRYNEQRACLAVSRANGSIEIWRFYDNRCWDQFGFIPADDERPIDTLEWTQFGHLLSAGIDGCVTQYNIDTCMPLHTFDTGSGAVWQIKHSPVSNIVAIGGEDSLIRLYEVLDTQLDVCLQYKKSFERQDSRILAIAWHPRGKQLCTSGLNTVRIWNTETGRMTRQLTLPKESKADIAVWSCLFMTDNTVIVGDSLGRVVFYDGKLGSLLHLFKIHDADVLCLAVAPGEKQIFASGVDPLFVSLEVIRLKDKQEEDDFVGREYAWRRSWGHKMHSHDVRSIEIVDNLVLSGGVDTKVVVAKQKRKEGDISKTSTILQSFRQTKICSISRDRKIFILQGEKKIDVWKMTKLLPSTSTENRADGAIVPSEAPVYLAQVKTDFLRWSRISPNGSFIAFSTVDKLKLYKVEIKEFNVQVTKCLLEVPKKDLPALCLEFSPDSTTLYFGNSIRQINVVHLSDDYSGIVGQPIKIDAEEDCTLRDIIVSKDGKWIVAMGCRSMLCNLETNTHLKLPSTTTAFTAMSFVGELHNQTIMAGTASRDIHEFTLEGAYTHWSNNSNIPQRWRTYRSKLISISQFKNCSILICDNESFTVLNRNWRKKNYLRKIKHAESENEKRDGDRPEFTEVSRWKYVLHCEMFNDNDVLLIERPVGEVMDSLPPTLKQKKFALK